MAILFSIKSDGGTGVSAALARVILRIGCCTGGVAGTLYEPEPAQDLTPTLGYGPLAIADARAAAFAPNAQRYALKVAATTAGTISSVSQTGSGPLITVAGSAMDALSATPYLAAKVRVKVIKAGPLGTARVAVALDGASYVYELDVPAESPATTIGTVDLTGLSLPGALDGLTLVFDFETPVVSQTVTFSAPATVAAAIAQVDALGGVVADLVQGKYLRVRRALSGTTKTMAVNASSTAELVVGLATATATGGASTVTLPGTGLVITFPAGDYVLGEIYSFNTTAPRASFTAITTAISAAITANPTAAFMHLVPVQTPLDDVDLRVYADGLDALCVAQEAADDKRFLRWMLGAPLDGSDAADKLAMASHAARYGTVVQRDCFLTAPASQPQGHLRVSGVEQLALRRANAESFSEDVGFGGYGPLECSLLGPDGTAARNEATAAIKMGGSKGAGFTALTLKNGKPYFRRGVTRAGSTSRFVDEGVATVTSALSAVLYDALVGFDNGTFDLKPDGRIEEYEAAALDDAFEEIIREQFVRARHLSRFAVTVDRDEKMSDTRTLKIAWKAQIRGQAEDINGTLTVGGTLTSAE